MRRLTERAMGASPEVDWKTLQNSAERIKFSGEDMEASAKSVQLNAVKAVIGSVLLDLQDALNSIPGLERVATTAGKMANEVNSSQVRNP